MLGRWVWKLKKNNNNNNVKKRTIFIRNIFPLKQAKYYCSGILIVFLSTLLFPSKSTFLLLDVANGMEANITIIHHCFEFWAFCSLLYSVQPYSELWTQKSDSWSMTERLQQFFSLQFFLFLRIFILQFCLFIWTS